MTPEDSIRMAGEMLDFFQAHGKRPQESAPLDSPHLQSILAMTALFRRSRYDAYRKWLDISRTTKITDSSCLKLKT